MPGRPRAGQTVRHFSAPWSYSVNKSQNPLSLFQSLLPHCGKQWSLRCQAHKTFLSLRMTDRHNRLILKAKLPNLSHDPEALSTLFETLARYSGHRLDAVIFAGDRCLTQVEFVFIEQSPQIGSTRWVNLRFDVPAFGLVPRPFGLDVQQTLNFDSVEF